MPAEQMSAQELADFETTLKLKKYDQSQRKQEENSSPKMKVISLSQIGLLVIEFDENMNVIPNIENLKSGPDGLSPDLLL